MFAYLDVIQLGINLGVELFKECIGRDDTLFQHHWIWKENGSALAAVRANVKPHTKRLENASQSAASLKMPDIRLYRPSKTRGSVS